MRSIDRSVPASNFPEVQFEQSIARERKRAKEREEKREVEISINVNQTPNLTFISDGTDFEETVSRD